MSIENESAHIQNQMLRWRSRRGLLELELVLLPFLSRRLESLTVADRERYARLLEYDDCDIFDWIQGRGEPEDPDLVDLVADIRASNQP
jgi:antitoxin CptB